MVSTIDRTRITAAELAEAESQYAAITRELNAAQLTAARASQEAADNWRSQFAQRASHEAWARVRSLTAQANRLAVFLQAADVDLDPEPTPPAAPAARPVGTIERNRRVIAARQYGTCRCCQKGIAPGQRITSTFVPGCWAHEACWERDVAQRKAEGERHRDRALGAMFLSFIERLPVAA